MYCMRIGQGPAGMAARRKTMIEFEAGEDTTRPPPSLYLTPLTAPTWYPSLEQSPSLLAHHVDCYTAHYVCMCLLY